MANPISNPCSGPRPAAQRRDGDEETPEPEALQSWVETPLPHRLAYVADMLRGLKRLTAGNELKFLNYLIAMALEETEDRARAARAARR